MMSAVGGMISPQMVQTDEVFLWPLNWIASTGLQGIMEANRHMLKLHVCI